MIRQRKGDLYVLSPSHEIHFSNRFTNTTEEVWHQRLGHPHMSTVSCLKSKGLIKSIGTIKRTTLYESCQLEKLSKFPFSQTECVSSELFEKIHYDLWGRTPVSSIGHFQYYACIVDDYSKYCWFIPLRLKFDFTFAYIAFKRYVHW